MNYGALVDAYERLEATASTDEKTAVLAELFASTDPELLPVVVTLCRGAAFPAWDSTTLGLSSSLTLEAIAKATGVDDDRIEATWRETGDLGDAAAAATGDAPQQTLVPNDLDVRTVHETLSELATYEGEGSQGRKIDAVARLLSDADPREARYVVRTVLGHLRVGVGDGTIRDAIAAAYLGGSFDADAGTVTVPSDDADAVERAYQMTNDYRVVAETARDAGREGLAELDLELFRPVDVMLAEKAESLESGLDAAAPDRDDVLLEYKYDGIRIQIHGDGDEVRLFTRRLEEVTEQFPDVVAAVERAVTADRFVLEAELVAHDPETGESLPFQELSKRVKRETEIERLTREIPVTTYCFDAIHVDGETLLDAPLRERLDRLDGAFEPTEDLQRARYLDPEDHAADLDVAREFYEDALAAGFEGIMVKNLAASYQPGRRVGQMMKVKPVMEPLDLVVTRAEWSEGRRSDYLGRLFLACRDPDREGPDRFREVGRLATGYTDEELAELTELLEPLVRTTDGRMVELDPEVILEIEYEEIQSSPTYDSGFALRFPRFLRRRDDLGLDDVDPIDRVENLFESQ